ncbi:acetolactate synthase [Reticulibacter mediterranei]|uniref:Acetolactate synthase n=1 Tax=Reticulibacter mediterranei TaxID=2778369 RepID=A0A8J3IFD1_9CHLR|nr:thiamine pyrophosphate-binding protein [Reticulibacter mediterranei]GHO90582.1 acetolactate synthase [Reticulibacter mediterranei]
MPMVSALQFLLSALEEEGVTHIFGVPGGPLVPLYEELDRHQGIIPILAKHEEGAAFMADGYARVRRGLGVCCATSGPGATNALTGVASAYSDSIPLLLLSGQVATSAFGKGGLQDSSGMHWNLDIVDIYRSATKFSAMLNHPQQTPHLIRRALRTALTGRSGAVHLSLPADVVKEQVWIEDLSTRHYRSQVTPAGNEQAIIQVTQLLQTARRPALFVGHGVNLAGAWRPLQTIAEILQAPVATTLKGKSAFPEQHPLSLGVFGMGGHPFADEYLLSDEIDLLMIIGTSLGELQTYGWEPKLVANRTVIQIDIDPLEIGKNYPVDVSILGDACDILTRLREVLSFNPPFQRRDDLLLERLRLQQVRYYRAEQVQGDAAVLKPSALVTKMNEIFPPETLLFVDNGNCFSWAGQYYVSQQPGSVFMALNVASMGYAVAAAIGGKVAAPDRPVVALVGDGAFAMNGMEVHTAVDAGIPVIWIVLNNGGHGMVYNGEMLLCGRSFSTVFRTPLDISTIARGLGARTFPVTTLAEFTSSVQLALDAQVPCVIDALVDLEEIPRALQRRADTLKAFFGSPESSGSAEMEWSEKHE